MRTPLSMRSSQSFRVSFQPCLESLFSQNDELSTLTQSGRQLPSIGYDYGLRAYWRRLLAKQGEGFTGFRVDGLDPSCVLAKVAYSIHDQGV